MVFGVCKPSSKTTRWDLQQLAVAISNGNGSGMNYFDHQVITNWENVFVRERHPKISSFLHMFQPAMCTR